MTRTRAQRLIRTIAAAWAILAAAIAVGCFTHNHPAAGGICVAVGLVAGLTAWLAGPRGRKRERRVTRHPSTNWRIETELNKFRAEISAWEAQQKAKP